MKISVVILTKNSQKYLHECLTSVFEQNYPDFEVIVVDATSTDDTAKILYYEMVTHPGVIVKPIMVKPDTTIGKARQIGVDNSQGEVIAFIDSDVELSNDNWFIDMMQPLECGFGKISKEMIAGTQTLAKCHKDDPWILKHLHNSFEYPDRVIGLSNYQMIGTGHCIIRKECIKEVGGFRDINSYEDLDVTRKIMETNLVFVYLPDKKVYHYHVDGIKQYIKKHLIRNKYNAIKRILFE